LARQTDGVITSGEHYGAVLNLDFDYATYLNELESHKFNLTRTFPGFYVEPPGTFKLQEHTRPGARTLICPGRAAATRLRHGGNKFDPQMGQGLFRPPERLHGTSFEKGCGGRVEPVHALLRREHLELSPVNGRNNIQMASGDIATHQRVYPRSRGGVLTIQETMVKKIGHRADGFDMSTTNYATNPYFGGVMLDWQSHMADVIVETKSNSQQASDFLECCQWLKRPLRNRTRRFRS